MFSIRRRHIRHILGIFSIAIIVTLVSYAFVRFIAFANLFGQFRPHTGIPITQNEIMIANTSDSQRTPVIPKILHQIYHDWSDPENDTVPAFWEVSMRECLSLIPEWEVKLWTTKASRTFIEAEYPWFLSTYDAYKFPIQRTDVLRYFLMRHYGGIYLDLDNPCISSLNPLIYYPAFVTDGGMGALSNNILGGRPDHPLFHLLTDNLIPWNWNWVLPYVTISFSSGQWFLTAMWDQYHWSLGEDTAVRNPRAKDPGPSDGHLHRIMMDMRPGADAWIFFSHIEDTLGESWLTWDSFWVSYVMDHYQGILFLLLLILLVLLTGYRRRKL